MADFYGMAARQVGFPRAVGSRPWGMPDPGGGDEFGDAFAYADEMKKRDIMRQKELMAYKSRADEQNQLRARTEAARQTMAQGPPKKNVVVNYGGAVKLPPSTVVPDSAANKAAQINKEFGDIAARREELAAGRASAEKIAGINSEAKLAESTRKGWSIVNRQDPSDPTKMQTIRMNNATGAVEPVEYEGENIGGVAKPGTKLPIMANPKVEGVRNRAKEALESIRGILDPNNRQTGLTPEASAATGWSRLGGLSTYFPGKAKKGDVFINHLKSNQLLGLVSEIKAASPTGALGFGNLSNDDRKALESAASRLDPNMDDEDFKKEAQIVEEKLMKILEDSPEEKAAKTPASPSPSSSTRSGQPAPPPGRGRNIRKDASGGYSNKLDPDEMLKKYGYGGQ